MKIIPMKRTHIQSCKDIVAVSEPWKTLHDSVDFSRFASRKQAYVCIDGGRIAGFVIFTPEPVFARGGYLRAIAVAPDRRGQGIGKRLMSFAEAKTARHSDNFYLCVSSFNRRAQSFYKSIGYTKVGKLPALVMAGASELIYSKRLAP